MIFKLQKNQLNETNEIHIFGETFHCWKKKGHGWMTMRSAIQRSCDVYFYEVAKKLGVDIISACEKIGIPKNDDYNGVNQNGVSLVHSTIKNGKRHSGAAAFLKPVLNRSNLTAITNAQVCRIILKDKKSNNNLRDYITFKKNYPNDLLPNYLLSTTFKVNPLFRNQENINFVKDAMFAATNEIGGTSYASRLKNKNFIFAGKTGSSQVKRFTALQRKLEVKQKDIEYKSRDHALFIAFAPVSEPRYAISVVVEHGGSGSSAAAPIAKQVIQKVLERHPSREINYNTFIEKSI